MLVTFLNCSNLINVSTYNPCFVMFEAFLVFVAMTSLSGVVLLHTYSDGVPFPMTRVYILQTETTLKREGCSNYLRMSL